MKGLSRAATGRQGRNLFALVVFSLAISGCKKTPGPQPEGEETKELEEVTAAKGDLGTAAPDPAPPDPDAACAKMTVNQRLVFCGPSAGEEVSPYVDRKGRVVSVVMTMRGDCLADIAPKGQTSFVPPLEAKCHLGPLKQCIRSESPKEPWEYAFPSAEEEPVWAALVEVAWKKRKDAWTHMRVKWEKRGDECFHWIEGLTDTDGDGVYSHVVTGEVTKGNEHVRWLDRTEVPEDPGVRLEDVLE